MKTNSDQIKAGADIHAGDGGYRIGTQEAHNEFVKNRNRSLAKSRLRELATQTDIWCDQNWHDESTYNLAWEDKFAELIVQECVEVCNRVYFNNYPDAEDFERSEEGDAIRKHFGVEE